MPELRRAASPLRVDAFRSLDQFRADWDRIDISLLPGIEQEDYYVGLAASTRCVELAQRLRYEVFNIELGEGLASSAVDGLDQDAFDAQMSHLVLVNRADGSLAGTYRLQTVRQALAAKGLYSAQEFDTAGLAPYFGQAVELGRACLSMPHRTFPAVIALWQGIGAFLKIHDHHYVFGCCSLTTQDPDDGWRALKTIRANGYLNPDLYLPARPNHSCGDPGREFDPALGDPIPLPKLFRTYMRLGTRVISEPAIDREFGTVDFLVMLDALTVTLSRLDITR